MHARTYTRTHARMHTSVTIKNGHAHGLETTGYPMYASYVRQGIPRPMSSSGIQLRVCLQMLAALTSSEDYVSAALWVLGCAY
jgi:hypothetical protein